MDIINIVYEYNVLMRIKASIYLLKAKIMTVSG